MKKFKSVYVIVMDSVGIGALPDAKEFGDEGANTFYHTISGEDISKINTLLKLGMCAFAGEQCTVDAIGAWGSMAELSKGKDTVTGHWELMGLVSPKAMPTYPNGFPERIISKLEAATNRKIIGNKPASGTEIIKELGEEHCRTGNLIVYTSADSVLQIAAHEDIVPIEELYRYCELAREIMSGDDACGRIIARPFAGSFPDFNRTKNRRDFALKPPSETLLDILMQNGVRTTAVGKIEDIFSGQGISDSVHSAGNEACIDTTASLLKEGREGFVFVNLVDFDMVYGHRNDKKGYFDALCRFSNSLNDILSLIDDETCLIITADHGCDPTDISTDHTREYVPIIAYAKGIQPNYIGQRASFADLAATVAELLGIESAKQLHGISFAGTFNI